MNIKAAIKRRIAEQIRHGASLEEASFNARQWARRMAAKERLKTKQENPPEEVNEQLVKKEDHEQEEKKNTIDPPKRGRPSSRTKR